MKPLLLTLVASGWLGMAMTTAPAQQHPVKTAVTIGMIGDVVENVGGSCVEVTTIMGPGVDPHLYQASAADVRTFQDADVIFYSGYSLEGQLGDVLAKFGQQKPTVAVSPSSIDPGDLITTQTVYGIDPHVWMDASLWSRIAPTIAATLSEIQPDCASEFTANAESYVRLVRALHEWVHEAVASIPLSHRCLVTAHDAFAYYGRAYGIEVAGIQGISTESEASVADIRATARLVAEKKVPAVFIESTINPRTIQAVIDAVREQGAEIELGGKLYSDAMGEKGTAGGTYIGMIFENTRNITQALGGTLPQLPDALAGWAKQWNVTVTAQ